MTAVLLLMPDDGVLPVTMRRSASTFLKPAWSKSASGVKPEVGIEQLIERAARDLRFKIEFIAHHLFAIGSRCDFSLINRSDCEICGQIAHQRGAVGLGPCAHDEAAAGLIAADQFGGVAPSGLKPRSSACME